ncbi:MAG: hypothetical protein CMJ65_10105 [Planctomycetaceae bacterium]|jgi:WD40 repeat protein|nr:hypothetical protein [Planctomycetaceae bacterium]
MRVLLPLLLVAGMVGCSAESPVSDSDETSSSQGPAEAPAPTSRVSPLKVENDEKDARPAMDDDPGGSNGTLIGRWKERGRSVEAIGNQGIPYHQIVRYDEKTGRFEESMTPAFGKSQSRQATWDPSSKTLTTRQGRQVGVFKRVDQDTIEITFTTSDGKDVKEKPAVSVPGQRLTPEQITEALELRIGQWTFHTMPTSGQAAFLAKRVGSADDAEFDKRYREFDLNRQKIAKRFGSRKRAKKNAYQPSLVLKGHKGKITSVAWSPDGKKIASGDSGVFDDEFKPLPASVKVWDAASGKELRTIENPKIVAYSIDWSPDSTRLAIKGGGFVSMDGEQSPGTLSVVDVVSGKQLISVEAASGNLFVGEAVAWSPDGKSLAAISGEDVVVWAAATGKRLRTLKYAETDRSVLSICWNPDGSRIAVGCDEEFVEIREVSTGKIVKKLQGEVGLKIGNKTIPYPALMLLVESVSWSSKSKWLASSSSQKLKIWDVIKGEALWTFDDAAKHLAWSPDGIKLTGATTTSLGMIKNASISVWDAKSGTEWKKFEAHEKGVTSLAWSPDGTRLASGGEDRGKGFLRNLSTVKIWTLSGRTKPTAKKLTAKEAAEVMAWEIGKWEIRGQAMPAEGQPRAMEMTMEARWKVEGKSVDYKFTLEEGGKTVSYFGHQDYNAAKGVFVYRSKWGENPETTSHSRYDPVTRTLRGQSVPTAPSGGPTTTTVTKRVGDDRTQQKLEVREDGRLLYSHETVSTRKAH